jgi:undecaprenyl-diphosphatase
MTAPDHAATSVEGARRYHRSPSDLLRLIVALAAVVVGFLVASVFDNLSVAATVETVEVFEALPDALVVSVILVVQLLAWLVPFVVLLVLLWQRRFRRFGLLVLAAALASVLAWGLNSQLISRFQPPALSLSAPTWICSPEDRAEGLPELSTVRSATETPGALFESTACVPGDAFPGTAYLAGFAGALGALTPWLARRWRRAAWIALALFLVVRTLDGVVVAADALLMLAVGYAVGAGIDLIFGSPDRAPTPDQIRTNLRSHGIDVAHLDDAVDLPAHSSTPYLASGADGRRLFIKVVGPDERAADILFRLYRMARFKAFGDERPASSLRRAVEHEGAMALTAGNDGVRTPGLVAMTDVGTNSMMLAFEAVDGSPLSRLDARSIDDATLHDLWSQLGTMRSRRMAHRNLGVNSVMVDRTGKPWLIDFGVAEVGAGPGELRNDVAEMLASVALVVGVERSVATAVAVLGPDAVADAAPRLQPHALSSASREALRAEKGMLDALRSEVMRATGIEEFELEPLQRVKPTSLITVVMLGLAFYFLIPQLAEVDLSDVAGADWTLLPAIVAFSLATYAAAALALMGAIPDRLRYVEVLMAQVASSFFNRIVPAKVGGMAANVRFLQKAGVEPAVAVAGVGVNNLAGFVIHITLTVIFLTTAGRSPSESISLPSGQTVLLVLVVVMTLAGAVMLIPWGRHFFLQRVWPILRKAGAGVASLVESPVRMAMLFGGSVLISLGYILSLWYSVEAFGGDIAFVSVAAVFLAGTAVAQAAPTPGGIGAAEAALIAGLTTFGLDAGVAVPAVFLYRLATFWLPVLPGWLAYRLLAARGAL